jgi:hypothetical protein
MKLIFTNKKNPCPICDNTSGKCRQSSEDQDYWQCMNYASARKGEIVNGYKCLGHTKDHVWGQFKVDNSQEWTDQQRAEWKQKKEQQKQRQAKEDDERRQRSFSVAERDKQYQALLAQLELHPEDKKDLVNRGFTQKEIELCGFKSVEKYQQLQSQFSELLPGITGNGRRLIISGAGYLCPIRNIDGLIIGIQIRLRSLPSSESGRYRWLSGYGQTLHLFPNGCDSSGELPLAVFRPEGETKGICLAEGTGAKPFLVSQRLNLFTIGAAGGQWASSPYLFKEILEKAEVEIGKKEITIFPDSGDIINPSVMSRWQRVITLLEKWGWTINIGWWGQIDKSHPDIDELKSYDLIKYITSKDFLAIVKLYQPKSKESETKEFDAEPQWKIKARNAWRKNRQFNADIKEDSEWCSFALPDANTMAFYKAGLGRGKTTRLRAWVEEWRKLEDVSFLCLGYRNTLLLQFCSDEKTLDGKKKGLGFYHLHEHDGMKMKSAPGEGIALCVDSLWQFSPHDFDNKIIILDEVKSVIKHLLHSSTVKNRDKIIRLFGEAIKRARQVVCLDGLMADWVVDYLHALAPEKKIIKAENTYTGKKSRVNFLLGSPTVDNKIKVNDRSPWLKILLEEAAIPAVCADSQIMIEALDRLLSAKGLNVLRVDSKTIAETHVKNFLSNCDKYIKENKPDALLYTPSAESGVDVSIPNYFTHHFAFFFGVIGIDGILQMTGRIRDNITKYLWCKSFVSKDEKQHSRSPFAEIIAKSTEEFLFENIDTLFNKSDGDLANKINEHLTGVILNSIDIHAKTSYIIQSGDNYEKSNLRECLRETLVQSGYKVVDCEIESEEDAKKKVSNANEEVKRQNSKDIFNAEKLPPDSANELNFDATWEERCKVIQAKLRGKLPGIDKTSTWTEDFIYLVKYENLNYIRNLENYWLFNHPDIAKLNSQDNLHWMARKSHTFIGNIKSQWLKIYALLEMDFKQFLNIDKEWSNESPELIKLLELSKKHSNSLGKHPGKSTPIQFLGNLLGLFGLKLKSRKDGKGKRLYQLDKEVLDDPIRQQVLACIETRFTEPRKEIDWQTTINQVRSILSENQPQVNTSSGLEITAPSPQFIYTNQLEGAVNISSNQIDSEKANQPEPYTESDLEVTAPSPQFIYINQLEGAVNIPSNQINSESANQTPLDLEEVAAPTAPSLQNVYTNQGEGAVDSSKTPAKLDVLSEEWLQPETLEDIATTLEVCPSQDDLAMLRGAFPASALQLAAKLLPPNKRSQIKQWVTNLNKLASKITLGSLCTYIGNEYRLMRLCRAKKLEIISIQGEEAVVSSEGWHDSITHRIPLLQLKLTT